MSLSIQAAAKLIDGTVILEDGDGKLIDTYLACGGKCIVSVYEDYYLRINNYILLIAVLEEAAEGAKVHLTAGGGKGRLYTDFGASKSMVDKILRAFKPYIQE